MQLDVKVTKVVYPPATQSDADWFVLITDQGKASGAMRWRPEPGEKLTLEGSWGAYRGERNFKFVLAMPCVPLDPLARLYYVCERANGLGPATADAIWTVRGEDWRNVESGEVKRLVGTRFQAFQDAAQACEAEGVKGDAIAWLMAKGCSVKMAMAAWEQWEADTVGVVQANCYRLADLPNYGFADVDNAIRIAFGIGDTDPRRVRAAISYTLHLLTRNGGTVADWSDLWGGIGARIGSYNQELICAEVTEMLKDGTLRAFTASSRFALGSDYHNETLIWEYVNAA